jgi:hypothetical protein
MPYWEYTQYYYAQVAYILGEDRYAQLFPESRPSERLTWNTYRATVFDAIVCRQKPDGSWLERDIIGEPFLIDAWLLTILQLDKGCLPIYQR